MAEENRRVYRHDVDGLRAVAIALVAGYHVWAAGRVSGGVDIFLMISGFFVGGALLRRVGGGDGPKLREYLPRLARRLLPALVLTLAGVVIGAGLFLPQVEWSGVSGGVLASLGYVENWRLIAAGQSYGAADPMSSPVQHIWSLSVQGQIFVGLPLALLAIGWLLRRSRLRAELIGGALTGVVIALAMASFGYALWRVAADQDAAYYDTGARAWEYLAGTLLAVLLARRSMPRPLANLAGICGLVLVVGTGVVLDGRATFPGAPALVPILGAALIIAAGQAGPAAAGAQGPVTRLLAWAPIATAGRYAYEFYLWHWVVLVMALAATGRTGLGWLSGSVVLITSAVLAWLTKRFTAPLGHPGSGAPAATLRPAGRAVVRRAAAVAVAGALVLTAPAAWLIARSQDRFAGVGELDAASHPGALTLRNQGLWPTPEGVPVVPTPLEASEDWPLRERENCHSAGLREEAVRLCVLGDPEGEVVVALIGGSHSVNFAEPIAAVAAAQGVRVDGYFKQGCPLLRGEEGPGEEAPGDEARTSCAVWNEGVYQAVVDSGAVGVLTTGTRPGRELDEGEADGDYLPEGYLAAWDRYLAAGIGVAAIRDNPWLERSAPGCVAQHGPAAPECGVVRASALGSDLLTDAVGSPLFAALDLSDALCDSEFCPAVVGNILVYIDSNHLTATYARTMTAAVADALETIPWWP